MNKYGVKVGQIWQDNDPRYSEGKRRKLKVLSVNETHAICENISSGLRSGIRLDRFKANSTGYCLIKDV